MSTLALVVRGLNRRFGSREAVRELNLSVRQGDVYGFLGPNGAGKTTAMRCILELIQRDSGTVQIFGDTGRAARRHVGAIVEAPSFHGWLSGRANLQLACAYAGISRAKAGAETDRVLERVGLLHRGKDRASTYSHGMKQRLAIARALLGPPRLLMLDEPTNGLDPQGMREVRELVRSLALHDQITVFLSSHLLSEVQAICNRVGILSQGELRVEGDVSTLLAGEASPTHVVEIGTPEPTLLEQHISGWPEITLEGPGREGRRRLRVQGLEIPQLVQRLVEAGVPLQSVVPEQRNLEDVFLEVTSGSPR
ncbi:MAG TPA: ABC transporter ATP-binding protein [Deltaproteobacteria bacterium]|nr:ABC transporter ATP-binding protein [Deltaproteobacteria bacterium]